LYDILLLDLWMPDMDGYEVADRIKKNIHPERRPLVVALTADTSEPSRQRCLQVGMDGVVHKPVSIAEMSNKLCAILRRATKVRYESMW
jgi:ethylene receptor